MAGVLSTCRCLGQGVLPVNLAAGTVDDVFVDVAVVVVVVDGGGVVEAEREYRVDLWMIDVESEVDVLESKEEGGVEEGDTGLF
jgi:hypothetical protein